MKEDAKTIAKLARLSAVFHGAEPVRIKHTVTDTKTGEVLRMGFWEPGENGWRHAEPDEPVN